MVTLVSAPGLLVFLVTRSSFFTWATASIRPLNKRALSRTRFISDVVLSLGVYNRRGDIVPRFARLFLLRRREMPRSLISRGRRRMTAVSRGDGVESEHRSIHFCDRTRGPRHV